MPGTSRPYTVVHRHKTLVRASHWINALVMAIMVMSGLQIFNAHPALYWGQKSTFERPFIAMTQESGPDGTPQGVTYVAGKRFETTGIFGYSGGSARGFPAWATLPSQRWLAMGRHWHFFFAWLFVLNGVIFTAYGLWSRHIQKDLLPTKAELKDIPRVAAEHARLHFPKGTEARHYNVIQKLTYLVVLFGLGPLVVLTGLTMSPTFDTAAPFLLDVFGGRQSARTIHFLCAFGFIAFFVLHILLVLISGVGNNLRSMITGGYRIEVEPRT